jgi:lipopolysaccharide export LptBFGC system permease protein LptF
MTLANPLKTSIPELKANDNFFGKASQSTQLVSGIEVFATCQKRISWALACVLVCFIAVAFSVWMLFPWHRQKAD